MLQNKLKSDVTRFTTHVQTCQQPFSSPEPLGLICNRPWLPRFPATWPRNDGLWGREWSTTCFGARNIWWESQNAQRCFATRFATMLQNKLHVFLLPTRRAVWHSVNKYVTLHFSRLQNSPYFCLFKYAPAVKQKVWNEAGNRERDWGETAPRVRLLRHTSPISLLILRKKPTVCSLPL